MISPMSILLYSNIKKSLLLAVKKNLWLLLIGTSVPVFFGSGVVALASPQQLAQANTATNPERPILKAGSQGAAVTELQAALKLLGHYSGTVDGVYNESTAVAVSEFQKSAGLDADGVVGPSTWEKLFPATGTKLATTGGTYTTPPRATTRSNPQPTPRVTPRVTPRPTPRATPRVTPRATVTDNPPSKPVRRRPTRPQTTEPSNPTNNDELPILRLGMHGPAVVKLQERLQVLGLFQGGIDGDFGKETDTAVKAAQERYGLTPDGVVGPSSWEEILKPRGRRRVTK